MRTLLQDVRYGVRLLAKNPGFTVVAALSLALGIGANTTVFCWIQSTLLRPLPGVRDAEELVVLASSRAGQVWDTVSYPDLKDYGAMGDVFAGVIGSQITPACLTIDGHVEWVYGQIATANFFDVLGVKPVLGRAFLPEEERTPGGHPVLVISHGFWERRFGADPGVIGRAVDLNRHNFTIVGVAPAGFPGTMSGLQFDFWAPLTMHREVANFGSLDRRGDRWLHTQARLAPGMSQTRAQAAVEAKGRQLEEGYPGENREIRVRVLPLWKSPYGGQSLFLPVLRVLAAVSAAVLLIVSANVANLLLARAIGRQKEVAIRLALGAGRGRLIRQFLTESLLLALLGGGLGTLLAVWGTDVLLVFIPRTHLPVGYTFQVDGRTLVFTASLTLVTAALFGLAPAVQSARGNLQVVLKEGGRGSGAGSAHHRLRNGLVVAEVALALLLLVGAGLCYRGAQRAQAVDIGFDPRQTLLAGMRIGMNGYTEETGKVFYRQLRERLVATPGVKQAALASWFPLGFEGGSGATLVPEGYAVQPNEDAGVGYAIVTPGYFDALRIPILEGRDFTERDGTGAEGAVIVNEVVARRYWPGQSPIGRLTTYFGDRKARVVGVVKAGKYRSLSEPPRAFVYFPYQQGVWDLNLGVVLRTEGDPSTAVAALRRAVKASDSRVELWGTLTMEEYVAAAFLAHRIATTLLIALGVVALALAVMGIYGVMAYAVSQRTHEIGVRMALGAQAQDVQGLVLRQGLGLAALGLGLGFAGALGLTHLLAGFLYGVNPLDPMVFAGVALLLVGSSLAACYLPARRASRVDPLVALRYE